MPRGSFNQCVSFVGRKYFSMSWGMQEPISPMCLEIATAVLSDLERQDRPSGGEPPSARWCAERKPRRHTTLLSKSHAARVFMSAGYFGHYFHIDTWRRAASIARGQKMGERDCGGKGSRRHNVPGGSPSCCGATPMPRRRMQRVVDLALSAPPGEASHWTGRMPR
jgi:hypothetical protein